MGQRWWKNGKHGLEEWYEPEDYWMVKFENIVSKIIAYSISIVICVIVILFLKD